MNNVASDRARMRTRGARLKATKQLNHSVSVSPRPSSRQPGSSPGSAPLQRTPSQEVPGSLYGKAWHLLCEGHVEVKGGCRCESASRRVVLVTQQLVGLNVGGGSVRV